MKTSESFAPSVVPDGYQRAGSRKSRWPPLFHVFRWRNHECDLALARDNPRGYAFLTTEPNAEVGAIHPKAMPVILTTPDEVETWMTAPADEVLKLQRPLSDGSLKIVARGVKEDPAGQTT